MRLTPGECCKFTDKLLPICSTFKSDLRRTNETLANWTLVPLSVVVQLRCLTKRGWIVEKPIWIEMGQKSLLLLL
jgi:hypothetical protein